MVRATTTTIALQIKKVREEVKRLVLAYKDQEEKLEIASKTLPTAKKMLKTVRTIRKYFEKLLTNLTRAENVNLKIDKFFAGLEKEIEKKKKELEKLKTVSEKL